jgi:lysophospholipase L1-like esterase
MPRFCVQLLITTLVVIAGLPLVNSFVRPRTIIREPVSNFEKYYSYEAAKKDPEVYNAWTYYAMLRWMEFERGAIERKGVGEVPYRLRPNMRTKLFNSEVRVNSLGFRGPEFYPGRTNAYRIITLGESTTFGFTLTEDQRPWSELLERKIRDRLQLQRPVEVINAGFPGRNLGQNIYRLKHELLEYAPDMIISYHGYNGFGLLSSAIPPPSGPPPPEYKTRPLKLLADIEYHVKLSLYRRSRMGQRNFQRADFSRPMETAYADRYRELIGVAEANHIQLVLANFSMAVSSGSEPDLIQFYRGGFPAIYSQIQANQAHSSIVQQLAAEHPDLCFVDTHPHLDGEHEEFVDLVHFNKKGEEQLSETMFAAIRPILERELGVKAAAK